jgi:hypothetical protein
MQSWFLELLTGSTLILVTPLCTRPLRRASGGFWTRDCVSLIDPSQSVSTFKTPSWSPLNKVSRQVLPKPRRVLLRGHLHPWTRLFN